MEVLKDKDCTMDTPVVLGVQDSPIYGKGISIKPRVDGRKDSKHFESIYLTELLPLEEYDLIVVLISGGKDSIACFYKLLELGVTKEKIAETARKCGFDNIIMTESLEEAVKVCAENAESGDAVLLSPACASWDMFPSYEVRGRRFKDLVRNL